MPDINVRLMTADDVDAVHRIEVACFPIPWSRESLAKETENACARYLVATEDGAVVSYAGVWFVLDEGHITNVAVRPDKRRMGYGKKTLTALMQLSSDSGMRYMLLECRASNEAAQSLYHKLGFVNVGRRKKYYEDNGEDAILMACEHLPEPDAENDPYLVREDE